MSKNIQELPYTELQERVLRIGRAPENAKSTVRGLIQDVYLREMPTKFDFNFWISSSSITTEKEQKTGTVSVNTGDSTVTFSGVTLTSDMTGRKLFISGADAVFDFTWLNDTAGTISPPFQANANASGNSYSIFQPIYALAADFDRFPKNGGVYKWLGGKKEVLREEPYQEYNDNFQASPSVPEKVRLVGMDTRGTQLVEFRPAPREAKIYGYDYFRKLTPLTETSDGTITIDSQGTTVTGASTSFTDATTGDWLRVDALGTGQDSSWYQIVSIADNTSLTLKTAFANTSVSTADYVISKAPDMPSRVQPAVLYGSLLRLALDQNDEAASAYMMQYAEVLSDAKRIHATRIYDQKIETIAEDYLYRR